MGKGGRRCGRLIERASGGFLLFQPKRVKDIGKPLFWQLAKHKVNHSVRQLLVISFNLEVVEYVS